jgi:tetratricopeptide (TPR) repeat protein
MFKFKNSQQCFIILFLILTTFLVYYQIRDNKFISLDDDLYITNNFHVKEGLTFKSLLWAFTTTHAGHWHPVTWLSHMLDYDLYGLNPGGHHITNLIFHIASTLLLFLVLKEMTEKTLESALVASLFALHPLHVESVVWVAERKDVLSTFFWMFTLWTYFRYVKRPKLNRYLMVFISFVLGLMSKPMVVTLPFVLLLLDYWPLRRIHFGPPSNSQCQNPLNNFDQKSVILRLILEKIPLFFLSAISCVLTFIAASQSGAVASLLKLNLLTRIENALVAYVIYIGKMIWPHPLAVLYPHRMSLLFWQVAGAGLFLMVITIWVIWKGKKRPYLFVGWLWYLGTLVPVIGIVQVGTQMMADRFTYVPLIGLFMMIAYVIPKLFLGWRHRKFFLAICGGLTLLILMIVSGLQVKHWQNDVTLFEYTLKVTVNNYLIHNNLGVTLMRQGKDRDAFFHYMEALRINPNYADANDNLGTLLLRQGKNQEAMTFLNEALRIRPDRAETHNSLAVVLSKQGKVNEAMAHLMEALRINPNYGNAHFNLGIALLRQGKHKEAIAHFQEALQIDPKDDKTHDNLAVALAAVGRTEEAIAQYNQALQINPLNTDAHCNLGYLLAHQGKYQAALVHYNKALTINPLDAQIHYQLGVILAHQGKNEEAAGHLSEALRIIPNYAEAHLTLGMLYTEMGKKDLALRHYRILKTINKNLANTLNHKISTHRN